MSMVPASANERLSVEDLHLKELFLVPSLASLTPS